MSCRGLYKCSQRPEMLDLIMQNVHLGLRIRKAVIRPRAVCIRSEINEITDQQCLLVKQ
jgi:hypothetical protein